MLKPLTIAMILLGILVIISIVCLVLIVQNIEILKVDPCRLCIDKGWVCFNPRI